MYVYFGGSERGRQSYVAVRMFPIFCRDLATLKRTLATWSVDIFSTTGSMCLVVISGPHTSNRA